MTAFLAIGPYIALALCLILLCQIGIAMHRTRRLLAEIHVTSRASFAILRSLDTSPVPDCTSLDTVFFGGRMYRLVEPDEGDVPVCDSLRKYQLMGIADDAAIASGPSLPEGSL